VTAPFTEAPVADALVVTAAVEEADPAALLELARVAEVTALLEDTVIVLAPPAVETAVFAAVVTGARALVVAT